MNEGDLSIDEATNQDLLRLGDGFKDCVDATTLGVCPPTALDCFADDDLRKARRRSVGRSEDDPMLSDEGQRVRGGRTLAHDAQGVGAATAAGMFG